MSELERVWFQRFHAMATADEIRVTGDIEGEAIDASTDIPTGDHWA